MKCKQPQFRDLNLGHGPFPITVTMTPQTPLCLDIQEFVIKRDIFSKEHL